MAAGRDESERRLGEVVDVNNKSDRSHMNRERQAIWQARIFGHSVVKKVKVLVGLKHKESNTTSKSIIDLISCTFNFFRYGLSHFQYLTSTDISWLHGNIGAKIG